ncbi:subtilisin-like serine protease-like protein PR1A [Bimuria novae-zelandiae CBS 107.79]|uniref:Subtilisin-like serine protease-like protein PR1A n=1 Tax=Bimuria novae-zelandiae CBS 107.79 TaxID=1447943 RepID=A0A6A5VKL2_9PLEO|nr:subtilisin-like serine protease-like protein PR1A [Bimuria novae-zelandiae CBS 107.79]
MYTSLLLAFAPAVLAAPLIEQRNPIPGKYIVKLKTDTIASMGSVKAKLAETPEHEFTMNGFTGFAGTLSDAELATLKASSAVEYIVQDAEVTTYEIQYETNAPWGLGRISHVEKGNTTYAYDSSGGEGTCSYVIDTGILVTHPEFEGRAEWLENFTGDGDDTDGYGHGTHVAGTIGSVTYGVAKKTKLYAVKVLDASGSGSYAGVIAGIDYVASDHATRNCPKGATANMSLGGGKNQAVNDAVAAAVASGVFFAIAAGNNNRDAANYSPASEPTAFTVAASDINDAKASFSNYGTLVDVWAPGVSVLSTWNDGLTNTISGTSMATPHVAGLAAYLLGADIAKVDTVGDAIVELSTKGVLTGVPAGTLNAVAFNGVTASENSAALVSRGKISARSV